MSQSASGGAAGVVEAEAVAADVALHDRTRRSRSGEALRACSAQAVEGVVLEQFPGRRGARRWRSGPARMSSTSSQSGTAQEQAPTSAGAEEAGGAGDRDALAAQRLPDPRAFLGSSVRLIMRLPGHGPILYHLVSGARPTPAKRVLEALGPSVVRATRPRPRRHRRRARCVSKQTILYFPSKAALLDAGSTSAPPSWPACWRTPWRRRRPAGRGSRRWCAWSSGPRCDAPSYWGSSGRSPCRFRRWRTDDLEPPSSAPAAFLEASRDGGRPVGPGPRLLMSAHLTVIGWRPEVEVLRAVGIEPGKTMVAPRRALDFLRSPLMLPATSGPRSSKARS